MIATRHYNYTDAHHTLPKLERLVIRLRAAQVVLSLFYAEEIRRAVIDMVKSTDRWRSLHGLKIERVPEGCRKPYEKSLDAIVEDGYLSEKRRSEIVELTDFRNDVGHRIDQLFSDLEQNGFRAIIYEPEFIKLRNIKQFNHSAVEDMERVTRELSEIQLRGRYVSSFGVSGHLLFSSTERVLKQDIKRLERALRSEMKKRDVETKRVNREIFDAYVLIDRLDDTKQKTLQLFLRYNRGRMTPRGAEICYRLFDANISSVAVCHVFKMKLPSIQRRRATWLRLGGKNRLKREISSLPDIVVWPDQG